MTNPEINPPPVEKRQRYIPFRKQDIVTMCLNEKRLEGEEKNFRQLCQMLSSIYHFEFHQTIEAMKDSYAAIDPDSDTRLINNTEVDDDNRFVSLLESLLEKANYEPVSEAELNRALSESSLFKIRLHVDFDEFSEVLLFCRGETLRQERVKRWLGLRSKTIRFINYDRVVVYLKFRLDLDAQPNSPFANRPGATLLKLFRNVPRADLEMLFPNTRVRMRIIDKLLIGIPALISGGIVLTTKLGASLILLGSLIGFWLGLSQQPVELNQTTIIVLLAGFAALGSYLWKQFSNFKNRKLRFMQTLTRNLYFKNLDNNAGVFHRIANDAEEEECKEAILAYFFLCTSDQPMNHDTLDRSIESWLSNIHECDVDFEIDDAISKLIDLGLIEQTGSDYRAISIDQATRRLDRIWDDYFLATET